MMEKLTLEIARQSADMDFEISRQASNLDLKVENRSESGGTNNYNHLLNKPSIEGVVLQGDKTFDDLGLSRVTEQEIDRMLYG